MISCPGMKMWNLPETAIDALLALPETGMGFQLVEAMILGSAKSHCWSLIRNGPSTCPISSLCLATTRRSS